jgi:hypothetical protein
MTDLLPQSVTIVPESKYPEYAGLSLVIKLPSISVAINTLEFIKSISGEKTLREELLKIYKEYTVSVSINGKQAVNYEGNPVVMSAIQDAVIGIITQSASI